MVNWSDVATWLAVLGAWATALAALRQLRLQRVQLEDQTRIQEREQANLVDVSARSIDGAQAQVLPEESTEPVHMVVVTNGSKRPVREVTVKIEACTEDMSTRHEKMADVRGTLEPYNLGPNVQGQAFVPAERSSTMPVLRAGRTAAFVWGFTTALYPRLIPWVRFTDDAGLHWEIDTSLHLKKLNHRDW